ncbi:DNA methyltransferase [Faecalicatena contorta]|uniref:Site-specific DNA-methyltransferase (Cytosine-N4-specific) n=1 Tax=Faecalicatena contorta TaxID=39482 RepID=A0A315ZMA5_9FIRM|nr:DNA methyltransferase [Faecalicatena contorta]PWJ45824.1 site-specific DNA-methyltransferase (cytosine-N4-specific) [Faecalicatena contorta]SUQ16430.1 site-specific DNA-methyltransferase (cytosine-N4-specific) [Faecalicatena contorta]
MGLVEKLNSYAEDYWDFADYRENNSIIQYPAKMVTPMQRQLLTDVLEYDKQIHNILDPFMGSGTVLQVGQELGLDVIGYDINPLAILISRVRLEGVPTNSIKESIDQLFASFNLLLGNVENHTFSNIEKWFRSDIIESLSLIRLAIMQESNIRIRRFFWCCFAETVKKFSNTRTSTFKLHVKEACKIKDMANNCIEEFKNNVSSNYMKYCFDSENKIEVVSGDALTLLSKRKENSVDIICTSPPYGDNHTTVTYGQYSILPLLWIDINDLDSFDTLLLNKFTAIDRESLGGRIKKIKNIEEYKPFIKNIDLEKQKKVVSFWHDYEKVFEKMAYVLKHGKLMALTLGNRRVNNQELPFDEYNDFLAEKYNLRLETTLTRKIMGKRMPLKVSYIAEQGAVKSMSKEYIKIYKKI